MSITQLWCYLQGEKEPFFITIDPSTRVGALQTKMKTEWGRPLQGIGAMDLLLWKVRYL